MIKDAEYSSFKSFISNEPIKKIVDGFPNMTTMLTTCAEGPECHVPEAVRGEDPHLEPVVSRGLQRIIAVFA